MRQLEALLLIVGASALAAATPDYFPLHVGNQWIYRQSGGGANRSLSVWVSGIETIGGRSYARVAGLEEGEALLRMESESRLIAYDRTARAERVWAEFATPVGGEYPTAINECNPVARVESRDAHWKTPAAEFWGALVVNYPAGHCADAGLARDVFAPWIGLVRREELTIAGPRIMELVYARVGGVTVLSEPEVAFSLSLDKSVYGHPSEVPVLEARIAFRSTHPEPVEFNFPGMFRFELVIRNERGDEVYRWSDGRPNTLHIAVEKFGPGERNFPVRVELQDKEGRAFPPGAYTAEAWLMTLEQTKRYASAVGFQIVAMR
jgi:hypothetical protein